ncbi:unnamed protein product [Cyprideis torosa]|uniref:Uncharacterized protein n=1 Tax=Cyprideis torosa TaxID=163714 RepID=A0A7R8WD96_9CRUS|nr:unnamed protein product [Cyprideis torosa]CAG0894459.1 unnamed protein product [Cyprideis torosa]
MSAPSKVRSYFQTGSYTEGMSIVTVDAWMRRRREMDGAEGLWRIGDKLYDLEPFMDRHPGGRAWLEMTQGTDITEAVEIYHPDGQPKPELLQKFYQREARTPRISPFTLEEDGFYKTLKRRVKPILDGLGGTGPTFKSKAKIDTIFVLFLTCFFWTAETGSYGWAMLTGLVLGNLGYAAHNFVHQRFTWRWYYMDFSCAASRSWQISHSISHHLYPNSIQDLEVTLFRPMVEFLVRPKNLYYRYVSKVTMVLLAPLAFVIEVVKLYANILFGIQSFQRENIILPLELLVLWLYGTNRSFDESLKLFICIQMVCSFWYILIGFTAGHHHPETYHDGDELRPKKEIDWGIFQIDATRDRSHIADSEFSLFFFGNHTLHHLFPAVDDGKLVKLYPAFLQTLKEFEHLRIGFSFMEWKEGLKGLFQQLSRTKPFAQPRTIATDDIFELLAKAKFD